MSPRNEPYAWLTNEAIETVQAGRDLARVLKQRHFRGPHVLYGAVQLGRLDWVLMQSGLSRADASRWLEGLARNATAAWGGATVEPSLESAMSNAIEESSRAQSTKISDYQLARDILTGSYGMREGELDQAPVSVTSLLQLLEKMMRNATAGDSAVTNSDAVATSRRAMSGGPQTALGSFGIDLSVVAKDFDESLYETQIEQIERVAGILGRLLRPSVLLVGDSGVGKSSLVDGLARWIHDEAAPPWLERVRLVAVSCSRLIASGGYRGQLEERLQSLIDAAKGEKQSLLFLDELHVLADPGLTGSGNLLGLFNEALSRNELRVIAAATTTGFESSLQSNEAFVRRFEIVRLKEPPHDRVAAIVDSHLPSLRAHYGLDLGDGAIDVLLGSCERFLPGRRFPAKALETLDAAFQRVRRARLRDGDEVPSLVTAGTVQEVISEETGVPVATLSEMDQAKLRGLQSYLDGRVFDQRHATATMSHAIQGVRLGLKDKNRTGGAFLFVGPPGTGKTELAKVLAEYLMGNVSALVRFNMSEFQTPESYQRLVGPPPGYVGYEAGGELTNRLTENPYSVVLFDEIEKGSSRVFDVFLQVLSDGHLTDNHGRTVDCKNSLFIMTSNALADVSDLGGAEIRQRLLQFHDPQRSAGLGPTFRREFIDRLEIVSFDRLSTDTLHRIAHREVQRVLDQVSEGQILDCEIGVDQATMGWLVRQIDGDTTGARSVQRLVEATVSRTIGDAFLRGVLELGKRYEVTVDDDRLKVVAKTTGGQDT